MGANRTHSEFRSSMVYNIGATESSKPAASTQTGTRHRATYSFISCKECLMFSPSECKRLWNMLPWPKRASSQWRIRYLNWFFELLIFIEGFWENRFQDGCHVFTAKRTLRCISKNQHILACRRHMWFFESECWQHSWGALVLYNPHLAIHMYEFFYHTQASLAIWTSKLEAK